MSRDLKKLSFDEYILFLDTLPTPHLLLDTKGFIVFTNTRCQKLTGFKLPEVRGKHFSELSALPASEQQKAVRNFTKLLKQKTFPVIEYKIVTKRKKLVSVQTTSSIVRLSGKDYVLILLFDLVSREEKEVINEVEINQLKLVQKLSGALIFELDHLGKINTMNKPLLKLLGLKEKDAIGKSWFSIAFPPKKRSAERKLFNAILQKKETCDKQRVVELQSKKGKTYHIELSCFPLVSETGKVTGILYSGQDITSKRKLESDLTESLSLQSAIFQGAYDNMFLLNEKGAIIDSNKEKIDFLGVSKTELIGKNPWEFSPKYQNDGELSEEKSKRLTQLAQSGHPQKFKWDLVNRKGDPVIVDITLSKIQSGDKPTSLAVVRDITQEMKKKNERLLYERSFDESLNAHALLSYKNGDPKIIKINDAFTELYGYTEKEILGKNPKILQSGLTRLDYYERMWKQMLDPNKGSWDGEIKNKAKSGEVVEVNLMTNTLFDEEGKPSHFYANHVDITQQKKDTQKLHDLDSLKSQLINTISHVIRTPLTTSKWSLELLLDGQLGQITDSQKTLVKEALDHENKILKIVSNMNLLLDLQRSNFDIHLLEQSPINIMNESISAVSDLAKARNVTIKFDYSALKDRRLLIDSKLIRLAFDMLVDNALRFSRSENKVLIKMIDDADQLKISIKDQGIGIPQSELAYLFEPFFRASNADQIYPDGVGIGLPIAKAIIDAHQGSLSLKSSESKGTTATVLLPL